MANPDKTYALNMNPGVQRDGTLFSSRKWTDGQWVRFYRSLPQKIGGYMQLTTTTEIVRGMTIIPSFPNLNVYLGTASSLKYVPIDINGTLLGPPVDRTPVGFVSDPQHQWEFDVMFSTVDNNSIIIAHAVHDIGINSTVESTVFYGDVSASTPLIPTGISVSGGVVVLHPYLFYFGANGDVAWSEANDPTTIMGSARVTASNILYGLQTRGGNTSPAGLLWSVDSVIRITQIGTQSIEFNFDTISGESSILSSRGIIEYDNNYYWAGIDRFLYYNGTVREVPNNTSLEYFFNNINYDQKQKVWATKITGFGEIWWHYPSLNSEECNKAIVYNIREDCWYDSSLSRSSGFFDQTFSYPIWTDNIANSDNDFPVWIHELGTDQNINGTLAAIRSYVESGSIAWCSVGPGSQFDGVDRWVYLYRLEPDFVQQGDMTLTIKGREYARSPVVSSVPYVFNPTTIKIDLQEQRREMTIRFESNVVGGFYSMGQVLMVGRFGDSRQSNAHS